ncbi:Aspartyl aminopeptidase [Drechslerella dactyloides]|uniref:aspartyl aminopeptidase n=1 Tax=Drechslerella dactyloides TaxID=74499 RepID=A0AAD6NIM9_DREDA|nr:Aspartyl aminopeptidase [Drechslerella dactyloides]
MFESPTPTTEAGYAAGTMSEISRVEESDEGTLRPTGADFIIENNRFTFSPGQLNKMINPKSLPALRALGGLKGLEYGLRTNVEFGLSLDHHNDHLNGIDDGKANLTGQTRGPSSREVFPTASHSSGDKGSEAESFDDRIKTYGRNILPERESKGFLWFMVHSVPGLSVYLWAAAGFLVAVNVYQAYQADNPQRRLPDRSIKSGPDWTEPIAMIVAILIVVLFGSWNDWEKDKVFAELNKQREDRTIKVQRSGGVVNISIYDLLVGDVVSLEPGDIIPADGTFFGGHNLKCTDFPNSQGSDRVKKTSADECMTQIISGVDNEVPDPFILTGERVLEGLGTYLVTGVGVNTCYGRQSRHQQSLATYTRVREGGYELERRSRRRRTVSRRTQRSGIDTRYSSHVERQRPLALGPSRSAENTRYDNAIREDDRGRPTTNYSGTASSFDGMGRWQWSLLEGTTFGAGDKTNNTTMSMNTRIPSIAEALLSGWSSPFISIINIVAACCGIVAAPKTQRSQETSKLSLFLTPLLATVVSAQNHSTPSDTAAGDTSHGSGFDIGITLLWVATLSLFLTCAAWVVQAKNWMVGLAMGFASILVCLFGLDAKASPLVEHTAFILWAILAVRFGFTCFQEGHLVRESVFCTILISFALLPIVKTVDPDHYNFITVLPLTTSFALWIVTWFRSSYMDRRSLSDDPAGSMDLAERGIPGDRAGSVTRLHDANVGVQRLAPSRIDGGKASSSRLNIAMYFNTTKLVALLIAATTAAALLVPEQAREVMAPSTKLTKRDRPTCENMKTEAACTACHSHQCIWMGPSLAQFFGVEDPLPEIPAGGLTGPPDYAADCRDRQEADCALTGFDMGCLGDTALLFPYSSLNLKEDSSMLTWEFISILLGEKLRDALVEELLSDSRGVHTTANGLSVDVGLRRRFETGNFALLPIHCPEDNPHYLDAKYVCYSSIDGMRCIFTHLPQEPEDQCSFDAGGKPSRLRLRTPRLLRDGDIIRLTTTDPAELPLPSAFLLFWHDYLWKILGATGLQGPRSRYEGRLRDYNKDSVVKSEPGSSQLAASGNDSNRGGKSDEDEDSTMELFEPSPALRPPPEVLARAMEQWRRFDDALARYNGNMASSTSKAFAQGLIDFINASPTPFHAVESAKKSLLKAGFSEIRERDAWAGKVLSGGKYFLTRNGSSIIAFAVGKLWKPGNPMSIVGAHTDSCALRLKPVSKRTTEGNTFMQVGVESYGGGLWHTWFDRDLSMAGRAMVRQKDGSIVSKLVKIDRPILRVPTLAIHLDRQEKFEFNKETQLFPILGLIAAELNKDSPAAAAETSDDAVEQQKPFAPLSAITERHHPAVVKLISDATEAEPEDVLDFEMILYDVQPGTLGGLNEEFIFSARLDNLAQGMTYCSVESLIASVEADDALDSEPGIRIIACFDHEEIGSTTAQGADSNLLPAVVRRLSVLSGDKDYDFASVSSNSTTNTSDTLFSPTTTYYEESLIKSFLISADMAHSVHPNYPAKYESHHRPEMNKGTVIKINANARYATNSPGIVLVQECARAAGVPLQLFVVRNDSSCGSTIGPMLSAQMGMRTLDLGNAQLSMHSIRETGGAHDVEHAVKLFKAFFERYTKLEPTIFVRDCGMGR